MTISLTLFVNNKQTTIEVEYDGANLDLSNRNITSLEGAVFPSDMSTLDISDNQITKLEELPYLTELNIVGNPIVESFDKFILRSKNVKCC